MYNLMIVDDERIILDSLYETLTDVFGDALNIDKCLGSTQALERIKHRVDILVTDIFMPRMDGIELATLTKAAWPKCRVIFITGDETVDSAQKAIRSGFISDYILKLEDASILIQAVRKASTALDQEFQQQLALQQQQARYQAILPMLQRDLLLDALTGEGGERKLKKEALALGMAFDFDGSFVLLSMQLEPFQPKQRLSHVEINRIFMYVDPLLAGFTNGSFRLFGLTTYDAQLLWLFQPEGETKQDGSYIGATLDIVQANCMKLYGCTATFVLNRKPIRGEHLPRLYEQICMVQNRYRYFNDSLFYIEDITLGELLSASPQGQPDQPVLEQLEVELLSGEREKVELLLEGMGVQGLSAELYYQACCVCMKVMTTIQMDKTSFNEVCALLLGAQSAAEQQTRLADAAQRILGVSRRQNKDVVRSVDWAVRYVRENLAADLSLTTVSSLVFHSPTYFSKLFKRTVGMGYCEYVTRQRLVKAADLLLKTDEKIYQIVKQVGFESAPYFIRIFKREYGCTPQMYRNTAPV